VQAAPSLPHERLIRKLETDAELSDEDKSAIARLPLHIKDLRAREDIVREGDHPGSCCLLIDGLLHRYKSLPDGSRVVLSYHIPGELPDLQSLFLRTMDHSLGAVTASQVAFIAHQTLHQLLRDRPSVSFAFWRQSLIDAAIFREWIVNLGARPARARLGHLICEFYERLQAVGLAKNGEFAFPITQAELGDAAGLSAVHINRSLQELRAEKLIATEARLMKILDLPRLKRVAGYESRYLHLHRAFLADTT
jgi:CRP-like cAMP-binding protein